VNRPVALVTGARRGIGLAIAEQLAGSGHDVALADLETDRNAQARVEVAGARAMFARFDLADLTTHGPLLDAVEAELGPIDLLVDNAGIASPVRGDLLELTPANFDRVIAVNLRGTVFLTQAVARRMLAGATGRRRAIILVTSLSAGHATPERTDYCISKAGLAMFVKTLALRLAPHGIPVFEVRPGIIRTEMTAVVAERYDRLIEAGLVPAGRWGEPADVARIVAGLASGAFAFATGSVIGADGGLAVPRL
jgi:3-oxoacyl-[acyl-carrier protein] reductase